MQPTTALSRIRPLSLDDLEQEVITSKRVARSLIVGLPLLGILASLFFGLPLFAALMSGCFLLATAYVCRQALVRFTGRTLRLLVASRLVVALVVGAVLFCATGAAWAGMVSALLLWLTADRLLGRHALQDLSKAARKQCPSPALASVPINQVNGAASRLFPVSEGSTDSVVQPRRRGRSRN